MAAGTYDLRDRIVRRVHQRDPENDALTLEHQASLLAALADE